MEARTLCRGIVEVEDKEVGESKRGRSKTRGRRRAKSKKKRKSGRWQWGKPVSRFSRKARRLQLSLLNQASDDPGRVGAWPARKGRIHCSGDNNKQTSEAPMCRWLLMRQMFGRSTSCIGISDPSGPVHVGPAQTRAVRKKPRWCMHCRW